MTNQAKQAWKVAGLSGGVLVCTVGGIVLTYYMEKESRALLDMITQEDDDILVDPFVKTTSALMKEEETVIDE